MAARGQWIAVGGILGLLAAVLVAGLAFNDDLRPVGQGSQAPGFEAVDLVSGDTVDFERHAGNVVLLNIWATWCGPCEVEMPSIERLHQQLGPEGLHVVAVSVDATPGDGVLEWIRERNLTFDVWHDRSGRIERAYQLTGLPETFVIDSHGTILRKVIGPAEWDDPAEIARFRRLLQAGEAAGTTTGENAERP